MSAITAEDLLQEMPMHQADALYHQLLTSIQQSTTGPDVAEGFRVALDVGGGKGKGLVATRSFAAGAEVLREQPFIATQALRNRENVLACANCFRLVGSVELQLVWRLQSVLANCSEQDANREALRKVADSLLTGALVLPFPNITTLPHAVLCPLHCGDLYCSTRCCAESWQKHHCLLCLRKPFCDRDRWLVGLRGRSPYVRSVDLRNLTRFGHDREMFGWLLQAHAREGVLWHTDSSIQPPQAAPLRPPPTTHNLPDLSSLRVDGACSNSPGPGPAQRPDSGAQQDQLAHNHDYQHHRDGSSNSVSSAGQAGCDTFGTFAPGTSGPFRSVHNGATSHHHGPDSLDPYPVTDAGLAMPPWVTTRSDARAWERLRRYGEMLETESVVLVAQLITYVMCTAQQCVWRLQGRLEGCAGALSPHQHAAFARARGFLSQLEPNGGVSEAQLTAASFAAAWEPVQAAHKLPFAESIACPTDMSPKELEAQLQVMITEVTTMLREALYDARFEAAFQPAVVDHLFGMLELNCLGITVESPIEDMKDEARVQRQRNSAGLMFDRDLRKQIKVLERLLSLIDNTDVPCDGTAFYVLQSCLNHDGNPNASCQKDIDEKDGCAVLTTLWPVKAGEELCISYTGENEDPSTLAEYGIPVS